MRKSNKDRLKMIRKDGEILGISLNSTSVDRVLEFFRLSLSKKRKFLVVTPYPEQIMLAQKNRIYGQILNSSDLSIPDGIGIAAANKFLLLRNPKNKLIRFPVLIIQGVAVGLAVLVRRKWLVEDLEVIKGREIFIEIIKIANKLEWKVYFFGGESGEAEEAMKKLQRSYKGVKIRASDGPILDKAGQPVSVKDKKMRKDIVRDINFFNPHILFVGMTPPKQERWLARWMPKLNIGGAMAIGGTFNYIAGRTKLPPAWMSGMGLEWLWRLFFGTQTLRRIIVSFPLFPMRIFWEKWSRKE